MEALSNALLWKIDLLWRYTVDTPGEAAAEADLSRHILMLITNEDEEINAIVIPSPQDAIWEALGSYAGIRLDLASSGAIGFAAMLSSFDLRTDDNRTLGIVLAAGGLEI
jgi:hypothetical protein